jgi:hypothetical protein
MKNFLIVCAVAAGLFVPLSLVAQDQRPDGDRGGNQGYGDSRDDHDRGQGDRRPQWQNRMSGRDQARFNSYYSRWLDAGRSNNRHEIGSMEKRMRGLMAHYSIPQEVRFSEIATGQEERR